MDWSLNWIDILVVLIVLGTTVGGFGRGLMGQTWSLVATLVSIYLSGQRYLDVAPFLERWIGESPWNPLIAFGGLYLFITMVLNLILEALRRGPSGSRWQVSGCAERWVAAAVGFLEGSLIVELFAVLFLKYPVLALDVPIRSSRFVADMFATWPVIFTLLPDSFRSVLELVGH